VYVPGVIVTGLYVPKFPPVSADGPDHIPEEDGLPPSDENKFPDEPFEQKLEVPFVPAFGAEVIVTVATLTSFEQGEVPVTVYWKVLVVAPAVGVNVPAPALNVPPLPVNLVHVPPASSPVINENKSTDDPLVSQTDVEPSVPALDASTTVTVAEATSEPVHGATAFTVYVIVVVPGPTGVTTPEELTVATEVFEEAQAPPVCPLEDSVVDTVSQIVVVPDKVPASGGGTMLGVNVNGQDRPRKVTVEFTVKV
jgi:hypothetical protein